MSKLYVIQYDQYGEYFVAVKPNKWTLDELQKAFGIKTGEHLYNGGGRRGHEDTWYHIRCVESGEISDWDVV